MGIAVACGCVCSAWVASSALAAAETVVEGSIRDPNRWLLQGLMDEGVPWPGKLDAVGRRMVQICAYAQDQLVQCVHPQEDASFQLAVQNAIDRVTVQVPAGGVFISRLGRWLPGDSVAIDLAGDDIFALEGVVLKPSGSPHAFQHVKAYADNGAMVADTYSRKAGNFVIRTNVSIARIEVLTGERAVIKEGPWHAAARLRIVAGH